MKKNMALPVLQENKSNTKTNKQETKVGKIDMTNN